MADIAQWREFEGGGRFKLASHQNETYQAALYGARMLMELTERSITDEEEHQLQCLMLGKFVVLDWDDGVTGVNGREVSYSPNWAAHLLKSNAEFFVWVIRESGSIGSQASKGAI